MSRSKILNYNGCEMFTQQEENAIQKKKTVIEIISVLFIVLMYNQKYGHGRVWKWKGLFFLPCFIEHSHNETLI